MKKSIAVIGLGRFGVNLVEYLSRLNVDIIAIDKDEKCVRRASQFTHNAFVCDCTSEEALREVGMKNVDHAIVAVGQNDSNTLVSTIVTTILLNSLGIKEITVRLDDESYTDTLKKIGAHSIISPLRVASERIATKVAAPNFVDYFKISDEYNITEILVPENMEEIAILELNSPKRFGANIVLIKRGGKMFTPNAGDFIQALDDIFVFGKQDSAKKLVQFFKTR